VLDEALLLSNIHGVLNVVDIHFELFIILPKSKFFEFLFHSFKNRVFFFSHSGGQVKPIKKNVLALT